MNLVTERRRQRDCPNGREEMNAYTQPANRPDDRALFGVTTQVSIPRSATGLAGGLQSNSFCARAPGTSVNVK